MRDFFISYAAPDRRWAEWIGWQLEEGGYKVVLQAWDFRPGKNYALEMNEATQTTERTLAVLSPDFLSSKFAAAEWASAFVRDPNGQTSSLLPIRVRPCAPRGLLAAVVYVDLVGLDEIAAREALLAGVVAGRAKPPAEPDFPVAPDERAVAVPSQFPGGRPRSGKPRPLLIAGGVLAAAALLITGLRVFGPHPHESPVPSVNDTQEPWDARDLGTALILIDRRANTYLDRARDLRDAFASAGRDAFLDEKAHARLNKAIRPYNEIREEVSRNGTQYVLAVTKQPKGSIFSGEVESLMAQTEALHAGYVLPLNSLRKVMNELVGKTGLEVDRRRDQETAKVTEILSAMDVALRRLTVSLRALEEKMKTVR